MNNNLITDANELLKKYALTGDRDFFIDAINKISAQIATAINPLNPMNRPFVAAILTRYADFVKNDFGPDEADIYSKMLEYLNSDIAECIVTIPVPTKGEKPNE